MKNPFKKLTSNDKDTNKRFLENQISQQAKVIVKKILTRKLKSTDIDILTELYKKYFEQYPDKKGIENAERRISQLKTMSK